MKDWYWSMMAKCIKTMHWSSMSIYAAGIKKQSAELTEMVKLTQWIEKTLPMCIEQLELEMASRNSFPEFSSAKRDYIMQYIWHRTSPLHKPYVDKYHGGQLFYDFTTEKPSIRILRMS